MTLAATPNHRLRLVRDEPDDVDVETLRRQLADARDEAAALRRRAARMDDCLSRLDGELRLAGRLQREFLPAQLPQVGPARFAAMLRPAAHVTGDFYDVRRLDEDHVGFYVADAVGHGVPAALLTMFIRHALTTKQIDPDGGYRLLSPGETLARLNNALVDQGLSGATFATAAYGIVNVHTRRVTIARAGHPHPVLLGDGPPQPIASDGGLLGIVAGEAYEEASFTLDPGQRLLLYTDGVEVAFAERAADSLSAWRAMLAGHASTADLFGGVTDALDRFNGDAPPRDDLTLLALDLD